MWMIPAVLAATTAVPGRGANVLAPLYKGQPAQDSNLVLGGWGSGTAKESKDEVLNGARSIHVMTDGYYSGGRLDFPQPMDLSRYAALNGVSFRFEIKFPGASGGTDNGGGLIPGGGYFPPGGPPMPGGMPGGPTMPGGPRTYPGATTEDAVPTIATHTLRVVLFSGASRLSAVDQAVDPEANTNGWIHVYVPLAAFKASGGAPSNWSTFKMGRMLLFGDAVDSFYVGDISLVQT
jgi:hypothetical protein